MSNTVTESTADVVQATPLLASKGLHLVCALALGATVLFAAGFAQSSSVHNAAHDMRHSQGFPCH